MSAAVGNPLACVIARRDLLEVTRPHLIEESHSAMTRVAQLRHNFRDSVTGCTSVISTNTVSFGEKERI